MTGWRHLLHRRRTLALALVLVALLARMLIPTGYMPVVQDGRFVMALCPGQGAMPMAHAAMAGMDHARAQAHRPADHHGSEAMKDGVCAFAGAALAATATVDQTLLALAILFIVATMFRRPQPPLAAPLRYDWPPRTGPPLPA
jgi:Na+/H+-translocating membrane pyrophosphatase